MACQVVASANTVPSSVNANHTCVTIPDNPETFSNLAPGDNCTDDKQCFGPGKCTANVCEANGEKTGENFKCGEGTTGGAGNKMCPIGQYCQMSKMGTDKVEAIAAAD